MTPRQCEIAAESFTACMLAQCGYDVLIQYGPHQPRYDLVAVKNRRIMKISVKGSQDGGWMLAVKYKQEGVSYCRAATLWEKDQRENVVFSFVQFMNVPLGGAPRVYVARVSEVAAQLKSQCEGRGYGALQEDRRKNYPGSKYDDRIPPTWSFSQRRIDSV